MTRRLNRRQWLLSAASMVLLNGQAFAFNRVQAGERYRRWLQQLKEDIGVLATQLPPDEPVLVEYVDTWCSKSIVPGSRAAQNFSEWINLSWLEGERRVSGEIAFFGRLSVAMHLLEASIPAGEGGLFPEPELSPYPDRALSVWYMHIDAGGLLDRYFDTLTPHRLPPAGTLERNVYPFLLFEDRGAALRLGGVSREWFGAMQSAYDLQFM